MTGAELFFEVGSEELPASYVEPALQQLVSLLEGALREGRVTYGLIETFATPRRLGVVIADVGLRGRDETEEVLGPPVRVAFEADGRPKVAAQKFAEKVGRTVEALEHKETPKGAYLCAHVVREGADTGALLQEALPRILSQINFPKSMRWGRIKQTFARPIRWLCALFDGKVIPFVYAGVASGETSRGHRFLAPEPFAFKDAATYRVLQAARYVVLDPASRRKTIREEAHRLAEACGGRLVEDEGLVDTNAFLVEYARPLLATFDAAFLELPREVLQTSLRAHQKCFVVVDQEGRLMRHFVLVSALPSKDEEKVLHGNQRVLRARLSDAQFFFNEDRKKTLASRVSRLDGVVFQSKLGSYGDKVRRLEAQVPVLAQLLGMSTHAEEARRAAHLSKADLVTGMVFEFTELQGIMGRYYALHDGETAAVADALRDHYLPAGQDDPVPTHPVGQLLALADRLDTLVGGFGVGLKPSGSADPYGLRRQAIGILRILRENQLQGTLGAMVDLALSSLGERIAEPAVVRAEVIQFLTTRLGGLYLKEGWQRDLVDAVCVDDLVAHHPLPALDGLLKALQNAVHSGILSSLAYSFKRVNNILRAAAKKDVIAAYAGLGALYYREESPVLERSLLKESAEVALLDAYDAASGKLEKGLEQADFQGAFDALCTLQGPIDRIFDQVMVMAEDTTLRDARLAMLRAVARLAFLDFARIETEAETDT